MIEVSAHCGEQNADQGQGFVRIEIEQPNGTEQPVKPGDQARCDDEQERDVEHDTSDCR